MLKNQWSSVQGYINQLRGDLQQRAPEFTGDLKNSIKIRANETGGDFNIEAEGPIYGLFQDAGVNGRYNNQGSPYTFKKMPPIAALEPWAKAHDIPVFLVARSIFNNGLVGSHFLSKGIDENIDEFASDIAEAKWDDYQEEDENNKKDNNII